MIFAYAEDFNGEPLYVFGLSHENLKRLKQGKPITFVMRERGADVDGRIVIHAAKTEEQVALELSKLIGPTTIVKDLRT